jgi:hypothetical protein
VRLSHVVRCEVNSLESTVFTKELTVRYRVCYMTVVFVIVFVSVVVFVFVVYYYYYYYYYY